LVWVGVVSRAAIGQLQLTFTLSCVTRRVCLSEFSCRADLSEPFSIRAALSCLLAKLRATCRQHRSLFPSHPPLIPSDFGFEDTPASREATTDEIDASPCEFEIDWENIWHGGKRLMGAKRRPRHRRVIGTKIKKSWIYRHMLCYVMLCIFFVRGAEGPKKSPNGAQDVLS
jgi:hypothetical protein